MNHHDNNGCAIPHRNSGYIRDQGEYEGPPRKYHCLTCGKEGVGVMWKVQHASYTACECWRVVDE